MHRRWGSRVGDVTVASEDGEKAADAAGALQSAVEVQSPDVVRDGDGGAFADNLTDDVPVIPYKCIMENGKWRIVGAGHVLPHHAPAVVVGAGHDILRVGGADKTVFAVPKVTQPAVGSHVAVGVVGEEFHIAIEVHFLSLKGLKIVNADTKPPSKMKDTPFAG